MDDDPDAVRVLGFVFNFLIGGVTGIYLADVPSDIHFHKEMYFVVAHFHYTIMGGEIFASVCCAVLLVPQITGRMYNERLGQIFALWVTIGLNVVFLPMFWVGVNGMNRRVAVYPADLQRVNEFISAAAFLFGAGFLLFIGNLLWSAIKGPKAPDNPWNASTLEWSVSSPPPHHNFPLLPEVVGHPYEYGRPGAQHAVLSTAGATHG